MLDNKIKIAMLELSDQNRAVLEFYFSSAGQKLYSTVSEDKADAFIIDYDYPGAIEITAEKLKTNNKPLVLLSVKEQALASTIWLAKPLTADALSNAAIELNEMINSDQVDIETENAVDDSIETLASKKETSVEDVTDIFKKLDEANLQLDTNKKIQARLAMAGTEALVSASDSIEGNIDLPEKTADKSLNETSHLEFAEILLDNEDNQTEDIRSEGEVDALLEALILGDGDKDAENSDDDNTNTNNYADLSLDEFSLHDDSPTEIQLENNVTDALETATQDDNSSDSIDLLTESVVVEDTEKNIILEEKESLSVDENFTLHDDMNSSEEYVYADTLEVKYEDVKQGNSSQNEQSHIGLDGIELELTQNEVTSEENIAVTDNENVDTHLDNLLKDVSIDTDDSLDLDSMGLALESNDETKEKSIDDSKDGTTLNNLLEEVSIDTESMVNQQKDIAEDDSFMTKTSAIEDDFDDLNKTNTENKENENDDDFNLQSLLNEVREEATGESEGEDGSISEHEQTKAEKRWMQLCGNNRNIEIQKDVAKHSYKKKNHLLGVILEQVGTIKGSEQLYRLKYNDLIIVLDHSENSIYCNLPITSDEFSEICFAEIEHDKVKIHDLDYSEVKLYRDKIEENPDRAHSIESFIWSTTLLTSRGRLPTKTNISQRVELKVWPDMTRIELPPHAMHIAAVFSKHPGNLLEVAEWMGIEQRHVFAFYNGALTLGMLELDSTKIKKPSFSFSKKNSKDKSEQRGLFGRLLKRLKS